MTIPYLTGFADPKQIENISNNLQDIFRPNKRLEDLLKASIAQNPGLVQDFADIEANSPGTLARMGFGKTGQNIAKTPQSFKSQVNRQASGKLSDPTFQEEAVATATGTQTTKQRKKEDLSIKGMEDEAVNRQLQIRINQIQADMAPLVAQGQTAEIKNKVSELERYQQARELVFNPETGILKRVGGIKNLYLAATGKNPKVKLTDQETGALMQIPEFKNLYESQQEDYWKERSLAMQKELATIRLSSKQQFDDYISKRNAELAAHISEKSGNPAGVKFIFEVLNNPTLGNSADPNYIQAANTIRDFQGKQSDADQRALFTSFRNSPDIKEALNTFADPTKMAKLSSQQVQNMVDLVNTMADQVFAGSPNAPRYQVTPVDKGILGFGKKFGVKQVSGVGVAKPKDPNVTVPSESTAAGKAQLDKDLIEINNAIKSGQITKEAVKNNPNVPQYIKDRIR